MTESGFEIEERSQYERPLMETGVGQDERLGFVDDVVPEEEVEVDDAGPVSLCSDASE